SVQVSSENAQKPAISRLAFTVLKGVRYTCAKALVSGVRQIEAVLFAQARKNVFNLTHYIQKSGCPLHPKCIIRHSLM
ncbi:MAG: hypothetical protein FWC70_12240, partial [Defluviitaleaceae bacterium]|nr:hypothetical protein [Defluviitaleaceae bacterium]